MAAPHPLLIPLLRGDDLPGETEVTEDAVISAEEHFVSPLVLDAADRLNLPIDRQVRTRLTADLLATEAEFHNAVATASRIARIADDLGIEIALFKGPAIALEFYETPSHRASIDVDLFAAPLDTTRLPDLVSALGGSEEDTAAVEAMIHANRVFEASFDLDGFPVDINRDPMNLMVLSPDEQARWDRTVPLTLPDGTVTRTLDLEDTVIQSLLHLFRDNFADLLHLNDVRLMLDRDPDWDEIDRRATANGYRDLVRYAVWFVSDQLAEDSPLPTSIARWRRFVISTVWRPDVVLAGPASHDRSHRRQFVLGTLLDESPGVIGRSYLERLFPPRAVIDHRFKPDAGRYPIALAKWRLHQRRQASAREDTSYGDDA